MRIIQLVGNKVWGGGEQYVYDLISAIREKEDANVTVVCPDIEQLIEKFSQLDIDITRLSLKGYIDFKSIIALSRLFTSQEEIVVHAHDFKRAFIALMARKMAKAHNVKVIMTRHLVRKAKKSLFENFVYKNIDKVIFVSKAAYNAFFSTKPTIDENKCVVVHNSKKEEHQTEVDFDLRSEYSVPSTASVLMYHGRIVSEKGIETIIEALKSVEKDFRMFFIGTGDEKYIQSIKNSIDNAGLTEKIIWVGYRKDVSNFINQCDCGIMPTIVPEAYGLSNIEYMRAGKPLITTNNGAQPEYITNGETGFLVNPNDAKAIANIINSLTDKDYAKRIGDKAQEYYNANMTYGIFYSTYQSIIDQLF